MTRVDVNLNVLRVALVACLNAAVVAKMIVHGLIWLIGTHSHIYRA